MEFHVFDVTGGGHGRGQGYTYERHFRQVELAERGGMEGYWFAEHHFDPDFNITPSPNLMIAAAASRTQRIRLGNMVTVLPYHHPLRAAEEVRMLDLLTNGRLDVGLGRGSLFREQRGWGVPREETYERFESGWDLLRRFLIETEVDYETPWYQGTGVTITPAPVQKPYPPMWLGAVSESSFEKAARMGMHCVFAFRTDRSVREKVAAYRRAWQEYQLGSEPGKFMVMCHVFVGESEADVRRYAKPEIDRWLESFLKVVSDKPVEGEHASYQSHADHRRGVLSLDFDSLMRDGLIIMGTPDQCVEQLERVQDTGVDAFQGWFQFGNLDFDVADRSLELFCGEVMPRLQEKASALQTS